MRHLGNAWTNAAEALVFALAELRREGHPELLLDTAASFAGLIAQHRAEPQAYYWSAEFISQLSLVMYDHMDLRAALELADLTLHLSEKELIPEHPAHYQQRVARMIKRFVLAYAPTVRSARERHTANLISRIEEAEANAKHDPQGRLSAQFTHSALQRTMGDTTPAIDGALDAIHNRRGGDIWSVFGLHQELALGFIKKKDIDQAQFNFECVVELAIRHRIKLIPVPVPGDLKDPLSIFAEAGLHAPIPRFFRRGANPFSAVTISLIVAALPDVRK